jgi:hypothetical protein
MSIPVACPRSSIRNAAMLVLGVVVFGCRGNSSPSLPSMPRPAAPTAQESKGSEYRQTAGTPIAPVVINDDPAPVAAPQAAPPVAAKQAPSSLNGDPNGITRETLNRAFSSVMGPLASCFSTNTQDPMVSVSFEADPSGKPTLLRVKGAPSDADYCIRNIVQNIRFPAFEGKAVRVDVPLSFHRVQTVTAGPDQTRPVQQEAPLNLEP